MADDLDTYLNELALDDCYRVDAVLKEGEAGRTERVYLVGRNGAERGPYVRKYISTEDGLGGSYTRIWEAQQQGRRFLYLPRIIECVDGGDRLIVIMEFVPGRTLAEELQARGASRELAADLFPKLCDAVRELHEGFDPPIVHRDLTPSNIMVSADNLSIIDFGIARSYKEGAEEDTRHFGTRSYAPPEQYGFGQTDVRSDVYALGALLYYLLVGRAPDAKARQDGFAHPDIPEPLRLIIARACAFDPDARYESVAQLQASFLAAMQLAEETAPKDEAVAEDGPAEKAPAVSAEDAAEEEAAEDAAPKDAAGPEKDTGPTPAEDAPEDAPEQKKRSFAPPLALGVIWDCLLVFVVIIMLIGCGMDVVAPTSDSTMYGQPLSIRIVSNAGMCFMFVCPACFALRDRRPERRLFPKAPHISVPAELAICVIVIVLYFALLIAFPQLI